MDKERVRHEERRERTRWEEMDHGGKKEAEGKGEWKAEERRRGSCMQWKEGREGNDHTQTVTALYRLPLA